MDTSKESKFQVGDVVELKSGGPPMTVAEIDLETIEELEAVRCVWFDKGKQQSGIFPPKALRKVESK